MLDLYAVFTWVLTVTVGAITFKLVRHYMKIRSLPPGPFPLPVVGNILQFRGKDVIAQHVLMDYGKKYNNIFTFWIGSDPTVIITSWDLCREALITRRNDFSGRVIRPSTKLLLKDVTDVISSDYGPCWEALKKLLVTAVRKYAVSHKLADLVTEVVDRSVETILKEGKPFEGLTYAYLIVYNIIASSAFGQRYEMYDPEFVMLRKTSEDLFEHILKTLPSHVIPILGLFFRKDIQKFLDLFGVFNSITGKKYDQHRETYKKGVVRDFTDALLLAKEEAEEEGKDSREFLEHRNLKMVLSNFFTAGTDTTKTNLLWILLIVCNKPEIQRKMQAEIDENIGSRSPRQEDKRICPYSQAVILESLRFRPVIDLTLGHKTICDTEVGGYKIPKDTSCLFHILNVHRDGTLWNDPDVFKPERFLEQSGQLNNNRFDGYMPFGIGRRACPGEKLALADVFLIVTRLLQKVDLELEHGPGSVDLNPELKNFASIPKKFYLVAKKRLQNTG